jgi:hypothetical protein
LRLPSLPIPAPIYNLKILEPPFGAQKRAFSLKFAAKPPIGFQARWLANGNGSLAGVCKHI